MSPARKLPQGTCPDCRQQCPPNACTDPAVAARRVLVRHLSHEPLTRASFPDRIAALLADLAPHLRSRP